MYQTLKFLHLIKGTKWRYRVDTMEAAPKGAAAATSRSPLTKVMVFCDGTWCGQLTGTNTNVKILADAVANKPVTSGVPFKYGNIVGCYFDGEGVEGGFADYILDGAIGGRIKEDCLEAYKFLMREFEKRNGHCEAWLIGLSRGSYTVRCVAGMINNCGLISAETMGTLDPHELDLVVQRAYGYYRDRTERYKPDTPYMQEWRRRHSRTTRRPPVKFMGLFETVGSLGIPALNPGAGVDYYGELNFYGKAEEGASAVSGEVERVYQALAVHDRCSVFNPCHVKRDKQNDDFSYNKGCKVVEYKTEELWFPGAHYDLGRQKFMFYKWPNVLPPRPWTFANLATPRQFLNLATQVASNLIERAVTFASTRVLRIPDIHPNYVFSDLVLAWMTRKMGATDYLEFGSLHDEVMNSDLVARPQRESHLTQFYNWVTKKPKPLENDAYDGLVDKAYLGLDLVPFAHRFLVGLFNRYLLMDRTIQDPLPGPAPPVKFLSPERRLIGDEKTYRSCAYDSYKLELALQSRDVVLVHKY